MSYKKYQHLISQPNLLYASQLEKLQTIKSSLLNTINQTKNTKNVQASYRSKANVIYKQKIKKVFHPLKMEQREGMLNFQGYFDQYLKRQNTIKEIPENDEHYSNQSLRQMTKKDIFQTILTLDVQQMSKLEKFKTKPYGSFQDSQQINDIESNIKRLPKILKNKLQQIKNKTPVLNSPLFNYQESKFALNSPLRRNKSKKSNKNSIFSYKSNSNSLQRSRSTNNNKNLLTLQNQYTPQKIIQKLNKFNNNTKFTQNNFKIQISQFKQILLKRYGNQVITNYFQLSSIISVNNICYLLNQFRQSSDQQRLMVAFLTFDVNKDGFICEDDLFKISQNVDLSSSIIKDVYTIINYAKQNALQMANQSFLPLEFLQNPKRKTYLHLFEQQNLLETSQTKSILKLPNLSSQSQHFIINNPQTQRSKYTYKKEQNPHKKAFRINFKTFLQIFQTQTCQFVSDFLTFLKKQQKTPDAQKQIVKKLRRKLTLQEKYLRSNTLELKTSNKSIQSLEQPTRFYIDKNIDKKSDREQFKTLPTQISQKIQINSFSYRKGSHAYSKNSSKIKFNQFNTKSQLSNTKKRYQIQMNQISSKSTPRTFLLKVKQSNKLLQRKMIELGVK